MRPCAWWACHFPLLDTCPLLPLALALCHGFNLDTENAMTFQVNATGFGQSVVQLPGSSSPPRRNLANGVLCVPLGRLCVHNTDVLPLHQHSMCSTHCTEINAGLQLPPIFVNKFY
nr:integrin alpha-M-like [Aotus nancymaae]